MRAARVSNLSAIFTVHFERVWKNQWGFLVDSSYVNLGGVQEIPDPPIHVDFEDLMTDLATATRLDSLFILQ